MKNNTLTDDQINSLKRKDAINLILTQDEIIRSKCNHMKSDGSGDALNFNPEKNSCRCTICGRSFSPINSFEFTKLNENVQNVINMIETLKILTNSEEEDNAYFELYKLTPMLEKLPTIVANAGKTFEAKSSIGSGMTLFSSLQNVFSTGYGFNPQLNPNGGMNVYGMLANMTPEQMNKMLTSEFEKFAKESEENNTEDNKEEE